APLIFIIVMSFLRYDASMAWQGFTLDHYRSLLTSVHAKIIGSSLVMALSVAMSCLLIAYPLAYYLAFKAEHLKNTLLFFLVIPFLSNVLILVYSWFFILEYDGLVSMLLMNLG